MMWRRGTIANLLAGAPQQADTSQQTCVQIRHVLAEDHCSQACLETWEAGKWQKLSLDVAQRISGAIVVDEVGALQKRGHQVLVHVL